MKLDTTGGLNRSTRTLFRLALKRLTGSFEVYHPVASNGRALSAGQRGCEDRWKLIEREIQRVGAASLLDLGCAEGYFVRRAATDMRCFSLGIDADVRRLMVAQTAVVLDRSHRAGYMLAEIDFDLLERLPV